MTHLGDITKINGAEIEPVDVITGGSPCQDLSVAGKRVGLVGERSGLFMEQIRIIKEMRNATNNLFPRYAVWENVPGAFSSNKGEDFRAVLEEFCKVVDEDAVIPEPPGGKWRTAGVIMGDGYSIAWRVFDAQYFGVPQRRRRIALVADFRGESAPEILFEREGVSGDIKESGEQGQRVADAPPNRAEAAESRIRDLCVNVQGNSGIDITDGTVNTLVAQSHGNEPCVLHAAGFCTEHSAHSRSIGYEEEVSPTLRAGVVPAALSVENHPADGRVGINEDGKAQTLTSRMGTGGLNVPLVAEVKQADQPDVKNVAFGLCSKQSHSMLSDNPHSGFYEAQTARTLDRSGGSPLCNQGGIAVVAIQGSMIGRADKNGPQGSGVGEDVSFGCGGFSNYKQSKTAATQRACIAKQTDVDLVLKASAFCVEPSAKTSGNGYAVRRLTPLECSRLQGYPDGWCDIGDWRDDKGKLHKDSDSSKYKALGNSIALPPWRWLLRRIAERLPQGATIGSLFDGIGGFPLLWSEMNGIDSCKWASEIESYCIAVTKRRFGEFDEWATVYRDRNKSGL